MSLSSLPEVRCSSYCFAKPELLCVPGITISSAIQRRMSKEQNWRTGLLTALSKSAIPFLSGLDKRVARNPFNMLPPDTEETVVSLGRIPNSLSLWIAPIWKRVARNPPPERLNPTESGIFFSEGK